VLRGPNGDLRNQIYHNSAGDKSIS